MNTGEIPRERWSRFFADFSNNHEGRWVSVEVVCPSLGAQEEATGLPLVGITADVKRRRSRVEVIVGDKLDAHVTRIVESARRVWLKEPEKSGHEVIEVQGDDGTTALLRFYHVEQIDRLLASEVGRTKAQELSSRKS